MPSKPIQGAGIGGIGNASGSRLPTLHKAPLPLDQLTQLQRRMAHLLHSITELQDHVMNAQTLDEWPSLLSRHLTIVSQTHSLSQFISLTNPNGLNAQLIKRDEILLEDALQNNHFSSQNEQDGMNADRMESEGNKVSHDALFGGKQSIEMNSSHNRETEEGLRLPKLRYSDGENNPLRKAAPHPFYPLDAEKAQTVIPSLLLPRGLDGKVLEDTERRWQEWLKKYAGIQDSQSFGNKELSMIDIETKRAWVGQIHDQIREYDTFASKAIRSFIHAREATDELGQRYDWKMRLTSDEDSDQENEEEEEEGEDIKMDDELEDTAAAAAEDRKRKRVDGDETIGKDISLKHVQQFLKSGHVQHDV